MREPPVGRKPDDFWGDGITAAIGWRNVVFPDSFWERIGVVLFGGALLAAAPIAMTRMLYDRGSDFPEFYAAGRYVLEHGARQPGTILAYYLPSLDVAWAAIAWMPFPVAAAIWYVIGCAGWIGLLAILGSRFLAPWPAYMRRHAPLSAGLLLMPLVLTNLCLGAFHILMLLVMVAGLWKAAEGRWARGGILLGLAAWLKLLPLLGVGYLLLKGRWQAALTAVFTALIVDVSLSVVGLGPVAAWEAHVVWAEEQARGTATRLLTSPESIPEHRSNNQSLPAVLRRSLTLLILEEPDGRWWQCSLVGLSIGALKTMYAVVSALLAVGIVWYSGRRGSRTPPQRWATEIALLVLATLWFSPVVWSYHFVAVAPALALVLAREPQARAFVWSLIILWGMSLCLLASRDARAHGLMLLTSLGLAVSLIWLGRIGPGEDAPKEPLHQPS